ncbi:RidA family protein [Spirosoma fluviale]|uniref:Enamine deaminase RidA, house cleaning of reactive enamine intermediates, YjgF/YER057c/UK114 family n=1 Tax=Spirosoma fluviale TaxID=1597977 RepID=A0A286GSJ4_9BACT|nr:RidA family protein [Spirosoma fluviale]SOD98515.1 Enamine deaminase RidA, house cleaning of reactive enamine intermediates, YjgF/YER057c/UK114 family [Spirosoma fluviale]
MKINQFIPVIAALTLFTVSCNTAPQKANEKPAAQSDAPEYFMLRPEVEKAYGYSHAVRIGNELKISGAVSMDDKGNLTAEGDLGQQMKNCYADLDKILKHYGYSWDDVVVENILTTNMPEFVNQSAYRNTIYKKQFPTGSWFGVKELALPGQLIEIELEAYKVR